MAAPAKLTFDTLEKAIASSAAAFRLTLKLEAVSPKVFPPTYEGGKYATEERIIADSFGPARELAAYRSRLNKAWPQVQVTGVDASGLPDTPEVGAPMTTHPDVDMVSFTGSTGVGRLTMANAAQTLKKVSLELGGKNPQIVLVSPVERQTILKSARWQTLPAVRAGRVIAYDTNLVERPSVKLGEAAVSLARIFHPGIVP